MSKSKQVALKVNCQNILYLEGYPANVRNIVESKDDGDKELMIFTLNHLSLGKKQPDGTQTKYNTPIDVYVYGSKIVPVAPLVTSTTRLLLVEGKLRKMKGAGIVIVADFVKNANPVVATVTLDQEEEE